MGYRDLAKAQRSWHAHAVIEEAVFGMHNHKIEGALCMLSHRLEKLPDPQKILCE
jgi:hypothetical protein